MIQNWGNILLTPVAVLGVAIAVTAAFGSGLRWSVKTFLLVVTVRNIPGGYFPNWWRNEPLVLQETLRMHAVEAILFSASAWLLVERCPKTGAEVLKKIFGASCVTLATIYGISEVLGYPVSLNAPFFGNPSMTATFIAIGIPLALKPVRRNTWLTAAVWIICLNAVICSHAVTPMLAALAVVVVMSEALWAIPASILAAMIYIGVYAGAESNGRDLAWKACLDLFRQQSAWQKFFGLGSVMQTWLPTKINWWWPHNDWLQLLIEYGWLGLIAAMALLVSSYRRHDIYGRAAVSAVAVSAVTNPITHWPIHAALVAVVVFSPLLSDRETTTDRWFARGKSSSYH